MSNNPYLYIERALSLYEGISRRDREEYRKHPERMLDAARAMGWVDYPQHILICLHDVLEVVEGVNLDYLRSEFQLTEEECEVLLLLTRNEGETSSEHFNRVLESKNLLALQVKYTDCMDNALMDYEDRAWYAEVLGESSHEAEEKYKNRAQMVMKAILDLT